MSEARSVGSTRWWRLFAVVLGLMLVAAACSGETESGSGSDADTTTDDDGSDETGDAADDESAGDEGEPTADDGPGDDEDEAMAEDEDEAMAEDDDAGSGGGEFFEDPRGGIFSTFQQGIDRSHPFAGLDTFCVAHDEAPDRVDTDEGITADAIEIQHMRQRLEDLVGLGFAVEVGDVSDMFERMVDFVNTECGGIRGRQIDLGESEWSPLEGDPASLAACVEATEDRNTVIAINSSGFQGPAILCLVEENETALITTQGLATDFMERGQDRLITTSPNFERALNNMVAFADDNGLLEGRTIAVIGTDTQGQPEAVQAGLIDELNNRGLDVAVTETLQCDGQVTCVVGIPEAVAAMADAGVDLVIPAMNILTAPAMIQEMVAQGFTPGSVQFMVSDFSSAAGDLVASKVAANGSAEAAALYDGAISVAGAATGQFWAVEDWVHPRFNAMCSETYEGMGGAVHAWDDQEENSPHGMLVNVCGQLRMAFRAIYDAGEYPTRADIYDALANLGAVDTNNMVPGSIRPGKTDIFDAVQSGAWAAECPSPENAFDENGTCWVPNNDYQIVDG